MTSEIRLSNLETAMTKKVDKTMFMWIIAGALTICLGLTGIVYAKSEKTDDRFYAFQEKIEVLSNNIATLNGLLSGYDIIN